MENKKGFDKNYWELNYSELDEMDGVANAQEHARYAKAFFDVEFVEIKSILDLGFGLGAMLKAFTREFTPYRIAGIEPSSYVYEKFINQSWHQKINSRFYNYDLLEWANSPKKELKNFDLAICTSVLQYVPDNEIDFVLEVLSRRVRYLYFSVPTSTELKRQREELEFNDVYAIRRSKTYYQKHLSKHFTFVSARILESKHFFDSNNSLLTDLLFRF